MPAAAVAFYALIVEDDPSSADMLTRAVERVGINSFVAVTVGEALLRIELEWPQAVVLDLRLPDADGTVLLRRLRRDKRQTRIAVLTGVADLSRYVDLMHFPPDLLLHKPVNLPKLLGWLEQAQAAYDPAVSGFGLSDGGDDDADTDPTSPAHADADRDDESATPPNRARRREARHNAQRSVRIRPAAADGDVDENTPAHDARLIDCSVHGVSITQAAPMSSGEWFSLTVGAGPTAATAIYVARNCTLQPAIAGGAEAGAYRIGAELVGFLSGPFENDPAALLRAMMEAGPADAADPEG